MTIIALLLAVAAVGQLRDSSRRLERQVQAAVLDSLFTRDTTQRVVVGDSTISGGTHYVDEDYQSALRMLGRLPAGLRANFERARRTRQPVDSLPTRVPVDVFDAAQRMRVREAAQSPAAYWSAFYRRFPHSPGWVELSRPGFNRDRTAALILVEYGCGGRCGGTRYVLLERRAGRWHVVMVAEPRMA